MIYTFKITIMTQSYKRTGLLFLFLLPLLLNAQQTARKFVQKTQYLLYLPDGYGTDTSMRWPLVMFLHGSGESSDNLEKVKTHGPPKLVAAGKKFPFIVISPQAWSAHEGYQPEVLYKLLEDVKKKYHVDDDRVYLTGLSMGGYETWEVVQKHPEAFAAITPTSGGGDAGKAWQLRHLSIWCFHGAKDDVVPVKESQQMVDSARKYNQDIQFTIYPAANHNSWEVTYNNDSVYAWLLSKKRSKYTAMAVPENQLKAFTGWYCDKDMDTVQIELENGKLHAGNGKGKSEERIEIKPPSATHYFNSENDPTEVIFQ